MKNILKIFKLSKPQHKWLLVASILITFQAVLQQATPITLKFVIDELTQEINSGSGDYSQLITLFFVIFAINISVVILNTLNQRLGDHIASRLARNLTEIYYRKIFTLPQNYFDSELSGKIINQLNRGIVSIREFAVNTTNFIAPAFLQAIFGIVVLSYYDLTLGIITIIIFPIYISISSYSTRKWGEVQEIKNKHEDTARGRIAEVISNIRLVKTYNTQKKEWKFISTRYGKINRLYDRQSTQYHILNFIREFGLEIAFIIILFIIFTKTFNGQLTLGEMVLVIQILSQLRWPLYGMSYILEQVRRADADSKEFFEVLDLPSTEILSFSTNNNLLARPALKLSNVNFSYKDTKTRVLKNINLQFNKRETVAIVGHSGAGKTTLVNLILKLYEPTNGEIYLSKSRYSKSKHDWIRSHMALVFQDSELFSSTIRENVAYGLEKASNKKITDALKKANALEFVSRYKKGIDTYIGERGVKLSGGQKQRIQIARAILHDKPILILDEATSSLDSKSEKLIQDALETLFKNRLVIIIAHRFSTIQNADKIVVLNEGSVEDVGSPQALARKKGTYAELLNYQIEGNKKLLQKYELE